MGILLFWLINLYFLLLFQCRRAWPTNRCHCRSSVLDVCFSLQPRPLREPRSSLAANLFLLKYYSTRWHRGATLFFRSFVASEGYLCAPLIGGYDRIFSRISETIPKDQKFGQRIADLRACTLVTFSGSTANCTVESWPFDSMTLLLPRWREKTFAKSGHQPGHEKNFVSCGARSILSEWKRKGSWYSNWGKQTEALRTLRNAFLFF